MICDENDLYMWNFSSKQSKLEDAAKKNLYCEKVERSYGVSGKNGFRRKDGR